MLSTVLSCELSQTVFHWRAHTPRIFAVCCVNAPGDATRRTRRDHTAKLQNRVIERERAAYEHLEGQLRNYSGELEVALTAHQEALGQIEALEAARKQEELAKENLLRDKDDWLRAQAALQERNLALERRVQELEAAAGAGLGKTDARYSVGVGRGKARQSLSLEVPESPGDILVRTLQLGTPEKL